MARMSKRCVRCGDQFPHYEGNWCSADCRVSDKYFKPERHEQYVTHAQKLMEAQGRAHLAALNTNLM